MRSDTLTPDPLAPLARQGNWEALIRAAAAEFVLPGLGRRLSDLGISPPAEISEFLTSVEALNTERNAQVLDEVAAVAALLNRIGIEPVVLKGAAFLIEGVYPRPGCRYLCDLDLLVPHSRLEEAARLLERDGYRQDGRDVMARFRHHYPQLQRPRAADGTGSAPLELHHELGHGAAKKLLSGEEVLRESSLRQWRGAWIRVPAPEHLVTHLILHSQLHHAYRERIWPPLRALYDLSALECHFAGRIKWHSVRCRFRRAGLQSTLLLHLLQAQQELGLNPPFAIELGLIDRLRWMRRQTLRRKPRLRFADPIYLVSAMLSRRLQFLTSVASAPGGWKYAARMLGRRGFYRRLFADVALR